jgi:hypothetical protein
VSLKKARASHPQKSVVVQVSESEREREREREKGGREREQVDGLGDGAEG